MNARRIAKAERYLKFLMRKRFYFIAVSAVFFVASIFLATKLELKPGFSSLLPQNLASVQQANAVAEKFGGTGLLLIGIESPDFNANKEFANALAPYIETLEGEEIKFFEYRFTEVAQFFERYGLHYLKTSDLFQLKEQLRVRIQENKDNAFGSFLGFDSMFDDEPDEDDKALSRDELLGDVDPRIQRFLSFPDNYLASDDGQLVAMGLQASSSGLSLDEAESLVAKVRSFIDELNPQSFHPEMEVHFAGNVQRAIEEVQTIKEDILNTAILLVVLILTVLFLFLWSPRWVALVLANLIFAVTLTFGFTQLAVGYLNTMTAFLSSLVAGTGINYAIIMISRYLEERRMGMESESALARALASTSLATLLASSTTAVSFMTLLVADNKGFTQFGVIGGVGVLLCWLSCFTMLPIWVQTLEKMWPAQVKAHPLGAFLKARGHKAGQFITRRAGLVVSILLVLSAIGSLGFKTLYDNPLEYDFSKLQNKTTQGSGASAMHWRIQEEVYKSSLVPAVVLLESKEQARELCPTVRNLVNQLDEQERVFEACLSLFELLPPLAVSDEETLLRESLRRDIRELMGDRWLKFSDSELAQLLLRIHAHASDTAPQLNDIPEQLTRRFEDLDGDVGLVGFIYPDNAKPLEDGRNLLNYTRSFKRIWLPRTESVVSAAGEHFVLADLLRGIRIDGPKASTVAFLSVMSLAFILTGSFKSGLLIALCMMFGTWWLLCLQGFSEIKYNFLNFIALPLTFGIGVDYPINVFLRFREQKFREYGKVLTSTGAAVILCSLTTIIGYSTLLSASNQALVSFARLALLGEIACITAAIILLPVLVRLIYARKKLIY